MANTIVVFTRKTIEEILQTGGSDAWKVNSVNARQMTYLVCTRNTRDKSGPEGPEPHGAGFLIGRISGVVKEDDNSGRYTILISEWARIDMPDLWTFGRNPVHYADIADLGIGLDTIDFEPMPERVEQAPERHVVPAFSSNGREAAPMTIAEAKRGLAAAFGVGVEAIEIIIRA